MIALALISVVVVLVGSPAPEAQAQEEDCTTYLAGSAGLLVYAEGSDPSSWSVDTTPAPWLLASLGFSGSGSDGGLSYNNDYLYASPGTTVTICVVDQIATILTSQGSSNSTSTWSNVIYDAFGEDEGSLQDCIDNIGYLPWSLSWPFCYNFYQAAYVTTTSTGYEVTSGSTGSTAASEDESPSDITSVAGFADCFQWGSLVADAYSEWQSAYDTLQQFLANADFEDDPTEFEQASETAYLNYLEVLANVFDSMPASLYPGLSDPQIAFDRVMYYFLATGDEAAVPALNAISEMIAVGADLFEFPDGLTPGAVAMSTWLIEACEIIDVLGTVDQFIANPPDNTDPPLDADAIGDLALTIADCAALNATVTSALDALENTAAQIDTHLALSPGEQDAAILAGLLAAYETQSGELTAALVALVDSLNFLTDSLEEIEAIMGEYLHIGSDLYEEREADDPLFVVDEALAFDVVSAAEVPHVALLDGLTTMSELTAAVPEELEAQVEWAARLCDLAVHFGEALSFVSSVPTPDQEFAEVWVPLGCGADGSATGLTADTSNPPDVGRGETKTEQQARLEASPIDGTSLRDDRSRTIGPAGPVRTEEPAPPTPPEEIDPVDSCSMVKKLVQVDIVGTQYENLSAVYGWRGYDPLDLDDYGPGYVPEPTIASIPQNYLNATSMTMNYGSAIVVQVLNEGLFAGRWSETFVATADEGAIRVRLDELVQIGAIRFVSINGYVNLSETDFTDYLRVRFNDAITKASVPGVNASEMANALVFDNFSGGPKFRSHDAVAVVNGEFIYELRAVDDIELRPLILSTSLDPFGELLEDPPPWHTHFLTVASAEANGVRWAHQFAIAQRQYDAVFGASPLWFDPHVSYGEQEPSELLEIGYPVCQAQSAGHSDLVQFERVWWAEMQRTLALAGGSEVIDYFTFAGTVGDCAESIVEPGASLSMTPYTWLPFQWLPGTELTPAAIGSILEG